MARLFTFTLGCRTNQYDTAALETALSGGRYERAEDPDQADLIVVQTCAVTERARQKSLQAVRKFGRTGRRVIVAGCGPVEDPAAFNAVPGVEKVFGVNEAALIAAHLGAGGTRSENPFPAIAGFIGRTRAHLKIQEGCDSFCAYCIVPRLRGAPRSRPFDDAVLQARRLLDSGFSEIVLTGIHSGRYNDGPHKLSDLLLAIAELPGDFRVRLSSVEPDEVDQKLLDLVLGHSKVCNHLHLPLQSGDPEVLLKMNRRTSIPAFIALLQKIRGRDLYCGLGTDIITGFPGENDARFNDTLKLIRELPLTFGHVFPFSLKKGTAAERLEHAVPHTVAQERAKTLIALFRKKRDAFLMAMTGREFPVIVESDGKGLASNYAPVFAPPDAPKGRIVNLHMAGVRQGRLKGRLPE